MNAQIKGMLVGLTGAVIGIGIGYVAYSTLNPPEKVIVEAAPVMEELSDEDLETLCAGLTEQERKTVLTVQAEVKGLQEQLLEREAELERLDKKIKSNELSRKAARKKWEALQGEIASLEVKLAAAEQERDELKVELQETLVELNKQVKLTKKFKAKAKKYRRQSTNNLWSAFEAQAKVKGCNRGSKRRHEKCHEAFVLAMNDSLKQRFSNCVDTYQAVPVLKKLGKEEELPQYSVFLNQESKFTKNWYVMFCDPSLPEARDTDLDDAPEKKTLPSLEDDLDINFDDLPEK